MHKTPSPPSPYPRQRNPQQTKKKKNTKNKGKTNKAQIGRKSSKKKRSAKKLARAVLLGGSVWSTPVRLTGTPCSRQAKIPWNQDPLSGNVAPVLVSEPLGEGVISLIWDHFCIQRSVWLSGQPAAALAYPLAWREAWSMLPQRLKKKSAVKPQMFENTPLRCP